MISINFVCVSKWNKHNQVKPCSDWSTTTNLLYLLKMWTVLLSVSYWTDWVCQLQSTEFLSVVWFTKWKLQTQSGQAMFRLIDNYWTTKPTEHVNSTVVCQLLKRLGLIITINRVLLSGLSQLMKVMITIRSSYVQTDW